MKLKNIEEVNDFLTTVDQCVGNVYLKSTEGDCLNLKSKITQYVAMGALLNKNGSDLELFCDDKNDEQRFLRFFYNHPETI